MSSLLTNQGSRIRSSIIRRSQVSNVESAESLRRALDIANRSALLETQFISETQTLVLARSDAEVVSCLVRIQSIVSCWLSECCDAGMTVPQFASQWLSVFYSSDAWFISQVRIHDGDSVLKCVVSLCMFVVQSLPLYSMLCPLTLLIRELGRLCFRDPGATAAIDFLCAALMCRAVCNERNEGHYAKTVDVVVALSREEVPTEFLPCIMVGLFATPRKPSLTKVNEVSAWCEKYLLAVNSANTDKENGGPKTTAGVCLVRFALRQLVDLDLHSTSDEHSNSDVHAPSDDSGSAQDHSARASALLGILKSEKSCKLAVRHFLSLIHSSAQLGLLSSEKPDIIRNFLNQRLNGAEAIDLLAQPVRDRRAAFDSLLLHARLTVDHVSRLSVFLDAFGVLSGSRGDLCLILGIQFVAQAMRQEWSQIVRADQSHASPTSHTSPSSSTDPSLRLEFVGRELLRDVSHEDLKALSGLIGPLVDVSTSESDREGFLKDLHFVSVLKDLLDTDSKDMVEQAIESIGEVTESPIPDQTKSSDPGTHPAAIPAVIPDIIREGTNNAVDSGIDSPPNEESGTAVSPRRRVPGPTSSDPVNSWLASMDKLIDDEAQQKNPRPTTDGDCIDLAIRVSQLSDADRQILAEVYHARVPERPPVAEQDPILAQPK